MNQSMVNQILTKIEEQYQSYTKFISELIKRVENLPPDFKPIPQIPPYKSSQIMIEKHLIDPFYNQTLKYCIKSLLEQAFTNDLPTTKGQIAFSIDFWNPYYILTCMLFLEPFSKMTTLPEQFIIFPLDSES